MKVRIAVKSEGAKSRLLVEQACESRRTSKLPVQTVSESDDIRLSFLELSYPNPAIRAFVGSVMVASTFPQDRVAKIEDDDTSDSREAPLTTRGRFLADWVGNTELVIQTRSHDTEDWLTELIVPMAVTAGKISQEEFARLFAELERESATVLLDIYGKTQIGLKDAPAAALSSPVMVLHRIEDTVREMDDLLRHLSKNPACKLKVVPTREMAVAGQAVTEATLMEACSDTRMLVRMGRRVAVREHLREHTRQDFRIREHRVIADFAEYLKLQLTDLRIRINAEMDERTDRRRWRNHTKQDGGQTWWETEDQPRIVELGHYQDEIGRLYQCVEKWSTRPFLPEGVPLIAFPELSSLFRAHPLYSRIYHAICRHFRAFQTTLDSQSMVARARSLPVLYEWWSTLRVLRILSRGLTPVSNSVSTKLSHGRKTLTMDFEPDQATSFEDGHGGRVRFRYNPAYRNVSPGSSSIGLLGGGILKTPDIAIELYPIGNDVPSLIILLDAKYSSETQRQKADEVKIKYSSIGDAKTGTILSRQTWALTLAPPVGATRHDDLESCCTVDNIGFWSESFAMSNPVNGAVRARPVKPGEFDPLNALIVELLTRSGIKYNPV